MVIRRYSQTHSSSLFGLLWVPHCTFNKPTTICTFVFAKIQCLWRKFGLPSVIGGNQHLSLYDQNLGDEGCSSVAIDVLLWEFKVEKFYTEFGQVTIIVCTTTYHFEKIQSLTFCQGRFRDRDKLIWVILLVSWSIMISFWRFHGYIHKNNNWIN